MTNHNSDFRFSRLAKKTLCALATTHLLFTFQLSASAFEAEISWTSPVTATAVERLIQISISPSGKINSVPPRLGLFIVDKIGPRIEGRITLESARRFPLNLFARIAGVFFSEESRLTIGSTSAEVVIFNSVAIGDLNRLDQKLPGSKEQILSQTVNLTDGACYFFSTNSSEFDDNLQTAYIFVGPTLAEELIGDCVYRGFLRAFGISALRGEESSAYGSAMLVEVLAARFVAQCFELHDEARIKCILEKIENLKK